jgi:hypothetical protein
MRKHNHNSLLIHALLALHDMQDYGVAGYSEPTKEVLERCARWLDAMVPPPLPEGEGVKEWRTLLTEQDEP